MARSILKRKTAGFLACSRAKLLDFQYKNYVSDLNTQLRVKIESSSYPFKTENVLLILQSTLSANHH